MKYIVKVYPIPVEQNAATELAVPPGADPRPYWIGTYSEHNTTKLVVLWDAERPKAVVEEPTR